MAATLEHECFPQPENPKIRVWRYMDFTKFVSFIFSQQLHFSRLDLLGDNWEGAVTKATLELEKSIFDTIDIPEEEKKASASQYVETMKRTRLNARLCQYANCWHMNNHESAAMWKLYSSSNESIAIQSTFEKLSECLPSKAYLGTVTYVDYTSDAIPNGNLFYYSMYKRASFSHECEARAIIIDTEEALKAHDNQETALALKVPMNANTLIETVHVSPKSMPWFHDVVREVIKRSNFKFPVLRSNLLDDPVF
ncbi:MAG: hypothetical protein R3E44_11215 [Paracoccaceae bacterium]